MIYLCSVHHRRSDICPRTGAKHEPAGAEASSRWVMLLDGEHLADVAAAESDPDAFLLLQEVRAAIPVAPLNLAICRREDFPSEPGVCNFHVSNPQKHCGAIPSPREMEISVLPGRDCQRPKARCPRCVEKFHENISAVIHRHYGTQPPAPILPPAPRELTAEEIAVAKRNEAVATIERVLCATAQSNRAVPAKAAAVLLAEAVETLVKLANQKEPPNVKA